MYFNDTDTTKEPIMYPEHSYISERSKQCRFRSTIMKEMKHLLSIQNNVEYVGHSINRLYSLDVHGTISEDIISILLFRPEVYEHKITRVRPDVVRVELSFI